MSAWFLDSELSTCLQLKYPLAENFLSFSSVPSVRLQRSPHLSNYPMTCGALISKQCMRGHSYSICSGIVKY